MWRAAPRACNSEPIADFFDVIQLGEGENQLPAICTEIERAKKEGGVSKKELLRRIAKIPGVYIPAFYDVTYFEDGRVKAITPNEPGIPAVITKAIIKDLNEFAPPTNFVVPMVGAIQDRASIEVLRGCVRGCRFCQAGFLYRPMRQRDASLLNKAAQDLCANTGYEELLRVTSLAVQLVDRQGNVYCCSENGRMVDRRELQAAMHGTVQLDEHTLLRSAPVQGGYVMWQTDITELVENMERLKENRTELAERNYLEQQNYEAERKTNALREKNRLYDLLQRRLAPQIIRMDQLLTRYRTAPEADRRQLLGQVAVLGAYLKRGANLMFLAQKHRYVPSAELRYALEESISSLELAGVECAMEVTQGVRLPAEAAAACYSRFESVVEGALGQMDALFVRAVWKDQRLNLYLSVETGADLKAVCPAAVQEAPGKRPADPLGHASHSFVIPPPPPKKKNVNFPESPVDRYPLRQRARTPLPRPGGSRKPSGAFFVGRTARSGRKKQGCSTSLWGSPVWLRGSAHGLPGVPEGCGSARGFLFLRSLRVVFQVQLGHQLAADDGQHLFQLLHVLFGEALVHPLDHRAQVGVADVVVVDILLGWAAGDTPGGRWWTGSFPHSPCAPASRSYTPRWGWRSASSGKTPQWWAPPWP